MQRVDERDRNTEIQRNKKQRVGKNETDSWQEVKSKRRSERDTWKRFITLNKRIKETMQRVDERDRNTEIQRNRELERTRQKVSKM